MVDSPTTKHAPLAGGTTTSSVPSSTNSSQSRKSISSLPHIRTELSRALTLHRHRSYSSCGPSTEPPTNLGPNHRVIELVSRSFPTIRFLLAGSPVSRTSTRLSGACSLVGTRSHLHCVIGDGEPRAADHSCTEQQNSVGRGQAISHVDLVRIKDNM